MSESGIWLANEGGESDSKALKLSTKMSRHIPNEMVKEYEPQQLREDLAMCRSHWPEAQIRSVGATYNCVGMVFATRRTSIDPIHIPMILEDDDYRRISQDECQLGDVVIYRKDGSIEHVGIIIKRDEDLKRGTITFKVLSKWGPWAEFVHDLNYVPESYGKPVEFWTDRKRP